jgi:hypothetical protein
MGILLQLFRNPDPFESETYCRGSCYFVGITIFIPMGTKIGGTKIYGVVHWLFCSILDWAMGSYQLVALVES